MPDGATTQNPTDALPKVLPKFEPEQYKYKELLPTFPEYEFDPYVKFEIEDRALKADPEKKAFLSACTSVKHLTPVIGTEIEGIDLRHLTDQQKNEMALMAAERGVLVFRNQAASIYELLDNARYYGPLHLNSTTGMPSDPELKAVHTIWSDGTKKSDWMGSRGVGWHSDQSYALNPMGFTALKIITAPSAGGDTIWSHAQAVLSTFSPGFIQYLEGLGALHSGDEQARRSKETGGPVRRPPSEVVHPIVRVHPVTGIKGLFVNPGYTRRIVGVPQHESDAILGMIYRQIANCPDMQVRVHWENDTVVMWDNRLLWHTGIADYFPERRHGLRATPMGEAPMSVAEYEKKTGKQAKDWYEERMGKFGVDVTSERRLASKMTKIALKDGD